MKKVCIVLALCLFLLLTAVACEKKPTEEVVGTMDGIVMAKNPEMEFRKLDEIYFPEEIFDTGLGLYIWNESNLEWTRTNSAEGKALFRKEKSVMCFAHGKGGNATVDRPSYYYNNGYNVLTFMWGTFARERDSRYAIIADKIWYRERMCWIPDPGSDDYSDNNLETKDVPDVTVAEIYGAFIYDLFEAFPDFSGSEFRVFGHSYGGMLTGALMSYFTSSYKNGLLPCYMLPDRFDFLDPYFSRPKEFATDAFVVPWLGEKETPKRSNVNEAIYQAALECRKLGIAVGLDRTSKSVCYPTTVSEGFGEDVTGSYWNFCNSIVYAHMSEDSAFAFPNFTNQVHGYGWSWYDEFNSDYVLKDASATVEEEAYCFSMSYEKMFAKAGTKYNFDVNGTLDPIDDDIVTSFYIKYSNDEDPNCLQRNDAYENFEEAKFSDKNEYFLAAMYKSKAKIAGFAYEDRNGNGKMDERLGAHFKGATVTVKDKDGNVIYETVTGINGYYEAQVDQAGDYTVTFSAPDGYSVSVSQITVTIEDVERQVAINNVAVSK